MSEQPLVLDTHVWIWIINGDQTIKASIRLRIQQALKKSRVLVPAICVWEVGMLWKKDRIQLQEPLLNWIRTALDKPGFSLAPITDAIAVESALLPGKFHNDPADCMIVATARLEKAILVTRDTRIIQYGQAGHVDVLST
jgi:PIN domain nuclease of toxin-antitoxin system